MKRQGFTLVELLMVVIIIGILVTLAVPNYYKSIERAKAGKAKAACDAIRKAQLQYRAFNDTYASDIADLSDYDLPDELSDGSDGDWTYDVSSADTAGVTITAERASGPYATSASNFFTFDQDGVFENTNAQPEWGIP
ncbi:MAG: prepilin-type N-terminal cleavage/methylation domain-containing protein [Candidatus Omnitrophota bacterium]